MASCPGAVGKLLRSGSLACLGSLRRYRVRGEGKGSLSTYPRGEPTHQTADKTPISIR